MPSEVMQALYEGRSEDAQALAAGRDLDVFEAAALGESGRLRQLLDEDASLANSWSDDGFTALHYASFFGRPQAARILAERGADLDARSTNEQFALDAAPLHSASAAGQLEVCRALLDAGADVNAVQHGGYTALLDAAANKNRELMDFLLERGADRNARLGDGRGVDELLDG